ncbi:hypothetical protein A2W13_03745 [Candidatus Woesebacteria bacterium RBG_16_36_11]|uniref:SCP domain-containing protein n=2 Tax=Candidatus Woeseibacteriota TaxID=1752722 RepID=A0A1F7X784_9BACT|nr:MAG: hypothetical protein A2Z67_06460 [Candidatus Woesebacteria bacterium RBG_13_36_22]OGM10763.1 MAG: hypothetical protein A2W13_03745 [Candidatus Woesebacteria bacterium RBG_16_36_11]
MFVIETLIHYLIPHPSNNHKAKLLHSSSLLIIASLLLFFQLTLYLLPKTGIKILGYASRISVDEIVRLTNEKRAQAGLSPVEFNPSLSTAAKAKGDDMLAKDYWAHVAPDGTQPWKFFTDAGYKYRYAGENLARDFSDASTAVEAWMASPTHRDNVLSSKYKDIGIAVVEGDLAGVDTTIIVELFGTQQADTLPPAPIAQQGLTTQVAATPLATSPVVIPTASPTVIPASPTPLPTLVAVLQQAIASPIPSMIPSVLISPFQTTRGISLFVVGFLMLVLILDGLIVSRRRIARIAGRTFAHLSFLGMILAIALILRAGKIL